VLPVCITTKMAVHLALRNYESKESIFEEILTLCHNYREPKNKSRWKGLLIVRKTILQDARVY
ncbi:MAG: hypothetical protein QN834_06690, partial [Nitrososphaeraceae archaeon]|nr:hypothetical protein [Nitrososphaeraceae archaeon]